MKKLVQVRHWVLSDQGQGDFEIFLSIYHNTNCQTLYLSFGASQEAAIKYVC